MAQSVRISCINKADRFNPWERITHAGGTNVDGTRWKLSQAEAIGGIENGKWSFFVERPTGDRVAVVVAVSAYGNKYLKTTADGDQPNNLPVIARMPVIGEPFSDRFRWPE